MGGSSGGGLPGPDLKRLEEKRGKSLQMPRLTGADMCLSVLPTKTSMR